MRRINIAAITLNQTPLDWQGNSERIVQGLKLARSQGVSIACFPELCVTGYNCEDMFLAPYVSVMAQNHLKELLKETQNIVAAIGLPVFHNFNLYNCVAVIADGQLLGLTAKKYLCSEGLHYESRWFKEWPVGRVESVECCGSKVPFGDVWYDIDGIKLGLEICHDAWVLNRHGQDLMKRGVEIILNPSASHFALGKRAVVENLCTTASRDFGVAYVFANLVGCEAGRAIYGGDAIIASGGKIISSGKRFSYDDVSITTASIDLNELHGGREKLEYLDAKKHKAVHSSFKIPSDNPLAAVANVAESWESNLSNLSFEEFSRAIGLGLFDYMRKSRSKGFVLSLSGGADSAAIACLVNLSFRLARKYLTPDGLSKKLSYIGLSAADLNKDTFIKSLLTTVYQATVNSSSATLESAKAVAQSAGAGFFHISIDELVQSYTETVSKVLDCKLDWKNNDLVLQNIQARVRSPSIWMFANIKGALLLTTSNRSEGSVGYATMDGDTSGGLAPIAGIDKAFIRKWLIWMERSGPVGVGAYQGLSFVNNLEPTAELRPVSAHQTDEADLMPYEALDLIERSAIKERKAPIDVLSDVSSTLGAKYSREQLVAWIKKFYRLWSASQWKRERLAPSFHIDEYNIDPRSWFRYPIFSGAFESELAEL